MKVSKLAEALLSKPLTDKRLLKLRRHLASDPWRRPGYMDPDRVMGFLDAIEHNPKGGVNPRAFIHNALVNMPTRSLPPLPKDIQAKLEAFQEERAKRAGGQ